LQPFSYLLFRIPCGFFPLFLPNAMCRCAFSFCLPMVLFFVFFGRKVPPPSPPPSLMCFVRLPGLLFPQMTILSWVLGVCPFPSSYRLSDSPPVLFPFLYVSGKSGPSPLLMRIPLPLPSRASPSPISGHLSCCSLLLCPPSFLVPPCSDLHSSGSLFARLFCLLKDFFPILQQLFDFATKPSFLLRPLFFFLVDYQLRHAFRFPAYK